MRKLFQFTKFFVVNVRNDYVSDLFQSVNGVSKIRIGRDNYLSASAVFGCGLTGFPVMLALVPAIILN
jgi:hypothetical protein